MTTKLYTAAEARRIDIERGGHGWIINEHTDRTYRHDDASLVWRLVSSDVPVDQGEAFVKDCWYPVNPEPEKPWSDKSQSEEKIEQLEKELAEATQNYHEILADHGELTQKFDELKENQRWKSCKDEKPENMFEAMLEGRTIKTWRGIAKQLEKELAEREKTINIQKQTISNREQELDKLKWKQRRKSCKGEKPTTNQKIIFLDGNSMLQRGQYIPLHSQWYLHVGEDHYIALASSTVENWTWKYEADL